MRLTALSHARALVLGVVVGASLLTTGPAAALERTTHPATPKEFRLLVLLVDFTDPVHRDEVPNHRSWQTADFVRRAFFQAGLAPTGPDGRRQASGSVADFVSRQVPGAQLLGDVYRYPAGAKTVDGWYQFSLNKGEKPYFGNGVTRGEQGWKDFYAAFLSRVGITDDWIRENRYDALYVLHGGGGGNTRCPGDGCTVPVRVGISGLSNFAPAAADASVRYDWLGTLQHEVFHLVSGLPDLYGPVWEHDTGWDILSFGNFLDAFPAPLTAWAMHMEGYGRVEQRLRKGESARIFLPDPDPGRPREMLILDNSSAGAADEFVVEYRNHHPADGRYDTAFGGMPPGNPDGLLVANLDRQARGLFASFHNLQGQLPRAFGLPVEDMTRDFNEFPLAPVTEIKRQDGALGGAPNDANDLFGAGQDLVGEPAGGAVHQPLRSSANPDGDVLWEFRNLTKEATGFSFDAQFQGRPLSAEALGPRVRWVSASGEMDRNIGLNRNGWIYEQYLYTHGQDDAYLNNLWIYTNRQGTAGTYSAEGTFNTVVAGNGERLTGAVLVGESALAGETARARLTMTLVTSVAGARRATPVLVQDFRGQDRGATQPLPEFSVDLTPWAGQTVALTIRVDAPRAEAVGILGAHFYRKAEPLLYDFVARAEHAGPLAPPVAPEATVTDQGGIVGRVVNARLEDGVTYGGALFMRPQSVTRGLARFRSRPIYIPPSGAVLRGAVGYPVEAVGRSDGAMMRITLDDGMHRLRAREWTPPLLNEGQTLVALGAPSAASFQQWSSWAKGLAWTGQAAGQWVGDWVRTGDFDGDGRDDVAVFTGGQPPRPDFTGGQPPRVGVALSTGSGFGPLARWHDYFAPISERPLVGRLNRDARSDIVTFTAEGDAYVALSTGERFEGVGARWGTDLALATEVPEVADVDGDGLDDVVVFSKYGRAGRDGRAGRGAASVWVALNDGGRAFRAPQEWSASFCGGDSGVPLAGDLDGDRRADVVCLDATGSVRAALSSGSAFGPATLWLSGGPIFRPVLPGNSLTRPSPGPHPIEGAVPFLTRRDGVTYLVWFNRSALYAGDPREGDVMAAPVEGGRFGAPVRWHDFFSIREEWPLVGDFDGDGRFDVGTNQVTRPALAAWHFTDCGSVQLVGEVSCYPGDLYVSPKPAEIARLGRTGPRLNRFALDLGAFAGRSVSLEITVDAGPSADFDMLLFPDLKLYGRPAPLTVRISPSGEAQELRTLRLVGGTAVSAAFPSGAVSQDVDATIEFAPARGNPAGTVGQAFDVRATAPDRTAVDMFQHPIRLEVEYTGVDLEGVSERDLRLSFWDEAVGAWIELDSVVNTQSKTITADWDRPGQFAVIRPRAQ
jgi:hypothetical protein